MSFTKETIDFNTLANGEIESTLEKHGINLLPKEILKIQNEILKRPPSLSECILWSIQGSEHSSYRSSRAHLSQFVTDGPTVIIGAKEDAGIISIAADNKGYRWCVVMSHESHNHPSQIVPYEGAATGIGGNVRDVACMGARVIAVADSLRFGDISLPKTKWIHEGVVEGIGGYGNPIGVPNIAGDLYYDEGYNDNCLVTVVTLGIVREDEIIHSYAPENAVGYDLILVGKPTDNSGFGGASFASVGLEEGKKEKNKGAVQEPNAFLERHLLKATYKLFDLLKERDDLNKVGFKDLGAGGVACASLELADSAGFGAEVYLDKIHTGIDNLHPSVILCSETQERFMWVVHPDLTNFIVNHYNSIFDLPKVSKGARASVVGKILEEPKYIVHKNGEKIVDALAEDITHGLKYNRSYSPPEIKFSEPDLSEPNDYNEILLKMLSHENCASRFPVYSTYDKQVQGRTITEAGDGDAGILQPFNNDQYPEEIRNIGISLSLDHNPRYGKIDPYWCGVNSVLEAMRNIAASGMSPQAITDCLCFGNPEKDHHMWAFVEAVRGVTEACKGYHLKEYPDSPIPIIAGNVSFYNESRDKPIPPSPMISCLGKIADVSKSITPEFKQIDSVLLMVGERKNECGGSLYYSLFNELGKNLPKPDLKEVENQIHALIDATNEGLILACHDISDGGVGVTLTEMSFKNKIGCNVIIPEDFRTDILLFSETGGFIIEVKQQDLKGISSLFVEYNLMVEKIGDTIQEPILHLNKVIDMEISEALNHWENGLMEKLE